jgi:hypothetical protein
VIRQIAASRVVSRSRCARMAGVRFLGMGGRERLEGGNRYPVTDRGARFRSVHPFDGGQGVRR